MTPTDWSREIAALTPFVQGMAVELCGPVRGLIAGTTPAELGENGRSHDLGTFKDAAVDTVVALGGRPLYSTSWQNHASRAVARKLGLVCYAEDIHFT